MKIEVGEVVQYFTSRTLDRGVRREKPEPIGPLAAIVTAVEENNALSLVVFMPNGRNYPAFHVTREPTTPIQHYWQFIPAVAHSEREPGVKP